MITFTNVAQAFWSLVLGLFLVQSTYSSPTQSWKQTASTDLNVLYHLLLTNHPGAMDSDNPQFKRQLDDEFNKSKQRLKNIVNYTDYQFVLSEFINAFHDGHLNLHFIHPQKKQPFPGFLVHFENNQFIIAQSTNPDRIPNGAKLISCEGATPKEMMLRDVFPRYHGNPKLPASWYTGAPFLLQGHLPSWHQKYHHCIIRYQNQDLNIALAYTHISELELRKKRIALLVGDNNHFAFSVLNPHTIWIHLPSFSIANTADLKAMKQIIQQAKGIESPIHSIIFDLRGNTGGDSSWGRELLAQILNQPYVDYLDYQLHKNELVSWRASAENINYLQKLSLNYQKQHGITDTTKSINTLVSKMKTARETKNAFVIEHYDQTMKPVFFKSPIKLVLVTDGFCASACLDFMDLVLKVPGSVQLGLPTTADTNYMDIHSITLPSNLVVLNYPMKTYKNRQRASNQYYQPSKLYSGDMANDSALKQWVLEQLR